MSNIDAASSNVFSQFLFTIWTDPNIEGVVYDLMPYTSRILPVRAPCGIYYQLILYLCVYNIKCLPISYFIKFIGSSPD